MMPQKPDAIRFRERLDELETEPWLGPSRKWWTAFAFRHTDITNVVRILRSEQLLCRAEIEASSADYLDSASPDIIDRTDKRWHKYVRFYFRPQTPTLFDVEGFRPKHRRYKNIHCPVPIYLLFDLKEIICRADSRFSFGSLARSGTKTFVTATDFVKLPFRDIYHNSSFSPDERDRVIFHRQAEVIVPKQLGLQHLKRIWCRSKAEYETLHFLLGDTLWDRWKQRITDRTDHSLFFRRWIYVENVVLTSATIRFIFNSSYLLPDKGPFDLRVKVLEKKTKLTYESKLDSSYLTTEGPLLDDAAQNNYGKRLSLSLVNLKFPQRYTVYLYIDGHLAYAGEYHEESDIPF